MMEKEGDRGGRADERAGGKRDKGGLRILTFILRFLVTFFCSFLFVSLLVEERSQKAFY